ncbi:nucleoside deaminase [Prescottella agglutinans]|uniref:tRNA(Arg) A34 adenosine deaminase TadA n=1 Tax=Prescottella agglutinans TaxID=1644129 RepID=A0ABT6MH08_9NOCA|nr:nucleoside deaminase [Prescottella agglutinans]MDH6283603.1 tRNA(Arg) A34 adenosine deaminase TadA [Prescottella agglutinans]
MMHTVSSDAETLLRRSISLADDAGRRGNRPFGAVITTADGTVIAEGRNEVAETGMVTAHAELTAIAAATEAGRSADLVGATIYASGEPCPMCSAAIVWAGITRVVFAAADPDFTAIIGGHPRFTLRCADVVGSSDAAVTVSGPHLGDEALAPFRRHRAGSTEATA